MERNPQWPGITLGCPGGRPTLEEPRALLGADTRDALNEVLDEKRNAGERAVTQVPGRPSAGGRKELEDDLVDRRVHALNARDALRDELSTADLSSSNQLCEA